MKAAGASGGFFLNQNPVAWYLHMNQGFAGTDARAANIWKDHFTLCS
jgi:hypothetical protein